MPRKQRKRQYLTLDELKALHSTIPNKKPRDKLLIYLMSRMGLRVGEAVNLRWGDISFTDHTINVRRTATDKTTTKGGNWRTIEIDPVVWDLLTRIPEHERGVYVIRVGTGERPMTTRNVRKLLRRYAKLAKIQVDVYPHILRHSFAIQYLQNGGMLEDLRRILGHSRLDVTQVYLDYTGRIGKLPVLSY